jgi:ANTAR domain
MSWRSTGKRRPGAARRRWPGVSAGVDLAEAFARLRTYARNHNLRLTDVAQAAIDGTLDPSAWAPRPAHS